MFVGDARYCVPYKHVNTQLVVHDITMNVNALARRDIPSGFCRNVVGLHPGAAV